MWQRRLIRIPSWWLIGFRNYISSMERDTVWACYRYRHWPSTYSRDTGKWCAFHCGTLNFHFSSFDLNYNLTGCREEHTARKMGQQCRCKRSKNTTTNPFLGSDDPKTISLATALMMLRWIPTVSAAPSCPSSPTYKFNPKSNVHFCVWCDINEHYTMPRLFACVPHCCLSVLSLALQCISLATKNSHIFSCSVSPLPSVCLADRKPSKQAANKSGYRLHPINVKYSKHTEAFNAIKKHQGPFY